MAKISKSQKAALEAAGYVVKGDSVQNKSGGSVGGYNANGKIWSGSDKVKNILKAPEPTAAPATHATISAYIISVMNRKAYDELLSSIPDKQEKINEIRLKFGFTII